MTDNVSRDLTRYSQACHVAVSCRCITCYFPSYSASLLISTFLFQRLLLLISPDSCDQYHAYDLFQSTRSFITWIKLIVYYYYYPLLFKLSNLLQIFTILCLISELKNYSLIEHRTVREKNDEWALRKFNSWISSTAFAPQFQDIPPFSTL